MAENELLLIIIGVGTIVSDYNYFKIFSREFPEGIENLQLFRARYLLLLGGRFSLGAKYNLYRRDASYYRNKSLNYISNGHTEVRLLAGYAL